MKRSPLFISILFTVLLFSSCSQSLDSDFNEANGQIVKKHIVKVQIFNPDNMKEHLTYVIEYDKKNKVESISDGTSSGLLLFNTQDELNRVESDEKSFDINKLFLTPYDAFEYGNVLEYDDNLNPKIIEVFEDGFDSEILTGVISYEDMPNPYFYTLEAAGIIDVHEKIDFNFGFSKPNIVNASLLLPNNNISSMIFKDNEGNTVYELNNDCTYDDNDYLIRADANIVTDNEIYNYTVLYSYK
jgi:hypothetical protein